MKRYLLFLSLVLACTVSALAHSTLDRSDPKNGAILQHAPNEIRMWFTEPLKVELSTIEVRNESGKQIDQKDLHPDQKDNVLVYLTLAKNLGPGKYQVSWTAVAQDMHVSKGSFGFQVAP